MGYSFVSLPQFCRKVPVSRQGGKGKRDELFIAGCVCVLLTQEEAPGGRPGSPAGTPITLSLGLEQGVD
jgi:hypothetical protein